MTQTAVLDRVTITGADDSIRPDDLVVHPQVDPPFIEWGILFSASKQGAYRFPSREWLRALQAVKRRSPWMKLSAHLCGRYVRDLVERGHDSWFEDHPELWHIFDRVQLNFHGKWHKISKKFLRAISHYQRKQVVFQVDGVNDEAWVQCQTVCDAVPFFDASGGAGVKPNEWPKPLPGFYNGYGGGLGPDNLTTEIPRILAAAGGQRIWIDMETKVRSEDDSRFEMGKVERCLADAGPFVRD